MVKEKLLAWMDEGTISFPTTLLRSYKQLGLNEHELVVLLQVHSFIVQGNSFPTPHELAERMTIASSSCSEVLARLIQRGFIEISEGYSTDNIRYEQYSLQPLWTKLVEIFLFQNKREEIEVKEKEEINLYSCFEKEFGRPLSPFECESLSMWIDEDEHDPALIKAALRESVISGKLNFRYIDRILFNWKKNGVNTVEEARIQSRKVRQYQKRTHPIEEPVNKTTSTVPFYNWLEN